MFALFSGKGVTSSDRTDPGVNVNHRPFGVTGAGPHPNRSISVA
jgi:hypothetical protein